MAAGTVVFLHGMFMTPRCWEHWVPRFEAEGLQTLCPPWPHHDGAPEDLRGRHPHAELGRLTLASVASHLEGIVRNLGEKPFLVGHSMGGLLVQLLVGKGLARAGVAIDSAPPKGVFVPSWSFLKSNWPVVNPFVSGDEPYLMSVEDFAYAFAHTLSADECRAAYERYVVPESRHVGRDSTGDAAAVDFAKPHVPLLFLAGELDQIIPAKLNAANFAKYKDVSSSRELHTFLGRTHFLLGQPGWEEVAQKTLDFLKGCGGA